MVSRHVVAGVEASRRLTAPVALLEQPIARLASTMRRDAERFVFGMEEA
ncbi:hypothetical protein MVI01_43660 [Myxococcus virescens]|uniref:Uncharacterized protein n=1 Tax=Myxococcus virescens TaxID=83456 RepID=A0A511HG95_9BACT|nr:hypothetical protein MVI01_43660 [Myxococcus virescens]